LADSVLRVFAQVREAEESYGDNPAMKTVLVTGGAGFVGSPACKALSRAGYLPVTFENLEHGHERAVRWRPLERGNLRHADDIARMLEARRPWAVMHFAAYAHVGESTSDPAKYYDKNIGSFGKAAPKGQRIIRRRGHGRHFPFRSAPL
jgi:nucleoside-diphosphate-sugar epimerase